MSGHPFALRDLAVSLITVAAIAAAVLLTTAGA